MSATRACEKAPAYQRPWPGRARKSSSVCTPSAVDTHDAERSVVASRAPLGDTHDAERSFLASRAPLGSRQRSFLASRAARGSRAARAARSSLAARHSQHA